MKDRPLFWKPEAGARVRGFKFFVVRVAVMLAVFFFAAPAALPQETPFASIKELEVPAAPGAREPSLFAAADGRVFLSWSEPSGKGFAVRMAIGNQDGWSAPRTITESGGMFVNWADFPSLTALPGGILAAHWLQMNGGDTYSYDVNIALSKDDGQSWSKPLVPHRDNTKRQHGFVSLLPVAPDRLLSIWLDGRNYAPDGNFGANGEAAQDAMALRSATITSGGVMWEETVLDSRTCSCCQTAAAITKSGVVVLAYRDRTETEIRDISILRQVDGHWTGPMTLNNDGWHIEACPVNGPAIDALGSEVAVAWFSAAGDVPQVNVAFSADEGASFGKPVRVDQGSPAGRVDLLLLPDGSALVSWLELTSRGEELLLCQVTANAACKRPAKLVASRRGRTIGFPRMALSGDNVYFAWTQPSQQGTSSPDLDVAVRTVVAKLKSSP